jgi:hypothetical protein
MKRGYFILAMISVFISCNENTLHIDDDNSNYNDFKYILTNKYGDNDTIYTFTYSLDHNGKVVSETYSNKLNQYHYFSHFFYDANGKLINEYREGKLFTKLQYNNDIIEVFRFIETQSFKVAEVKYQNQNIVQFIYGFEYNNIDTLIFDFDKNENVLLKRNNDKTLEEYLDYDNTLINPFYSLKSIEIFFVLRNYIPISKNVYKINQVYPIVGDDYSTSMQYFNFYYETDKDSRIIKITDEKTLIYAQLFKYDIK